MPVCVLCFAKREIKVPLTNLVRLLKLSHDGHVLG